jgi:hypothetical protein
MALFVFSREWRARWLSFKTTPYPPWLKSNEIVIRKCDVELIFPLNRGCEQITVRLLTKFHPELQTFEIEQFLTKLRFEQRDKLAELRIELKKEQSG